MSVLLNFRTSVQQGSTEQKVKKLERTAEGTQRDGKREDNAWFHLQAQHCSLLECLEQHDIWHLIVEIAWRPASTNPWSSKKGLVASAVHVKHNSRVASLLRFPWWPSSQCIGKVCDKERSSFKSYHKLLGQLLRTIKAYVRDFMIDHGIKFYSRLMSRRDLYLYKLWSLTGFAKSVRWLSGVKGVAWRVYSNIRVRDGGWEGNILSYGTSLSSESAFSKHLRFQGNEGNQRLWIYEALPLAILFSWAKGGLVSAIGSLSSAIPHQFRRWFRWDVHGFFSDGWQTCSKWRYHDKAEHTFFCHEQGEYLASRTSSRVEEAEKLSMPQQKMRLRLVEWKQNPKTLWHVLQMLRLVSHFQTVSERLLVFFSLICFAFLALVP